MTLVLVRMVGYRGQRTLARQHAKPSATAKSSRQDAAGRSSPNRYFFSIRTPGLLGLDEPCAACCVGTAAGIILNDVDMDYPAEAIIASWIASVDHSMFVTGRGNAFFSFSIRQSASARPVPSTVALAMSLTPVSNNFSSAAFRIVKPVGR